MSLINRETLYEKACDLEAQALAYVGKIVNDETKIEEWKIWSAILVERTAFKHDIFDAPSAQPEIIHCKDCKHWREGTAFSYCDKLHGMGVLNMYDYMKTEDEYCSMAERRIDESD